MALSKTKQKKLEASKKKIRKTFREMQKMGLSPKGMIEGTEKRNSNNTHKQYAEDMCRYASKLAQDFGIGDITKAKTEHFNKYLKEEIDAYGKGDLSAAHRIRKLRSVVDGFKKGTKETGVFKKEIDCIHKDEVNETLKERNVIRLSGATQTLSIEESMADKLSHELLKSRSPNKEQVQKAWELSTIVGTRVMDVLKAQVKDVEREGMWARNSKGGLTSFVPFTSEKEKGFVHGLTDGKKSDETPLIPFYDKRGKLLSTSSAKNLMDREVKKAGGRLSPPEEQIVHYKFKDDDGVMRWKSTTVEKNIKFHSSRKAFVNKRFDYYVGMSEGDIEDELLKRLVDPKVNTKYKTAVERINKNRKTFRDMHRYEKAIFITSLDARHFRSDIITAWYLSRAKVKKEKEAVKKVMAGMKDGDK